MRHKIPAGNWTFHLADAIELAQPGDVIEVHNAAMLELAQDFAKDVCPGKDLGFEVVPLPEPRFGKR